MANTALTLPNLPASREIIIRPQRGRRVPLSSSPHRSFVPRLFWLLASLFSYPILSPLSPKSLPSHFPRSRWRGMKDKVLEDHEDLTNYTRSYRCCLLNKTHPQVVCWSLPERWLKAEFIYSVCTRWLIGNSWNGLYPSISIRLQDSTTTTRNCSLIKLLKEVYPLQHAVTFVDRRAIWFIPCSSSSSSTPTNRCLQTQLGTFSPPVRCAGCPIVLLSHASSPIATWLGSAAIACAVR